MYELDGNAVADLRGVAADVKEEASKPASRQEEEDKVRRPSGSWP